MLYIEREHEIAKNFIKMPLKIMEIITAENELKKLNLIIFLHEWIFFSSPVGI